MTYDPSGIERLLQRKKGGLEEPVTPKKEPWVGPIKEVDCPSCPEFRFVFRNDEDYDDPDLEKPCHRCETPDNPTRGWLVREYARRGLDEKALSDLKSKSSKDAQKIDKFLRKALGIEVKAQTAADLEKEAAAKQSAR